MRVRIILTIGMGDTLMGKTVYIDFECQDPYLAATISKKALLGAGWAYGYNCDDHNFKVLGCAVNVDGASDYITDYDKLRQIVESADTIVAHNATYELGTLAYLYKGTDFNWRDLNIHDTMIMYKLYNSAMKSYSLDNLGKTILKQKKQTDTLGMAVWKHDLFPYTKTELKEKDRAYKKGFDYERKMPSIERLNKFAYDNMGLLQQLDYATVAQYAIVDVNIMKELYEKVVNVLPAQLVSDWCLLVNACVEYRLRGMPVDLVRLREVKDILRPKIAGLAQRMYDLAGEEFNPNSIKDLPRVCDKLGLSYPSTDKGNPSITSPWMETQDHSFFKSIVEYRKYTKLYRDYICGIEKIQEYTGCESKDVGIVFPELNILRARTGRFSCSNPNMQQIPREDPELGSLCRSIFIPFPGEKIYSLDYSNQEGRLQVHFANRIQAEGADNLVMAFENNPTLDMHQRVADMALVERTEAKTINLGISYGMGIEKLGKALGMKRAEAYQFLQDFHNAVPYLKELVSHYRDLMKGKGFIKTLTGRVLRREHAFIDGEKVYFDYKALNLLVQGSAADQTAAAMRQAFKERLPILMPIHDQFLMSGTQEQAERLKTIMETCVILDIPSVVDVYLKGGDRWSEAGH